LFASGGQFLVSVTVKVQTIAESWLGKLAMTTAVETEAPTRLEGCTKIHCLIARA
jgi:hypothetical protein